ncbi:hypothetical protein C0989_000029 [Termitomyces sp. Mn162]|nr:hypothetical protein C0989_000029 [Termitomyces sp. Mn162]
MCYAHGSIDQAVNVCPMCKVFFHPRCPHVRDVCHNRIHPHIDVSYLKNAEVDTFNGCGYCKWARTNPKQAVFANAGWPGCCRAPTPAEHKLIQPADWRSVSVVHQVPIPPDIKAALESLGTRGSPVPNGVGRAGTIKGTSTPDHKLNGSPSRSVSLSRSAVPSKQWMGSPKQTHSSIGYNLSRNSSSTAVSTSVPTVSTVEQVQAQRRQSIEQRDGPHSSNSPPKPKIVGLDASLTPRRNSSTHKPSISPFSPSISPSKASTEGRPPPNQVSVRQTRRSSVSITKDTTSVKPLPPTSRTVERSASLVTPRSTKKDGICSGSSSNGSDSTGSMTDGTVTSDGGFTDYLSDESEAELQRQAEARAALLAQYQAEELEFKAARQQLAHIDLRPPKTWNPTNITNNTTLRRIG